jgi:DcmR-like sensory protein
LGRGEHCIIFGHDEAIEKVKSVLRTRGFDPDALIQKLQLTVLRRQSSAAGTLSDIADTVQAAVRAGASAVRFLGNLGMGRAALPAGENDVVDLECKVSSVIQGLPCVIVCMYDVSTLSGRLILNGGLKTHRLAVGSDGLRENPYYQPDPDTDSDISTIQ